MTWASMSAVIHAADRHLQSTVDALAFFLMRRGLSKGMIRWGVTMAMALSYIVEIGSIWPYSVKHPAGAIFMICLSALWTVRASVAASDDARAEGGGMLSRWDGDDEGDGTLKAFLVASVPPCFLGSKEVLALCGHDAALVSKFAGAAAQVFFLVLIYLKKTPRTPPPIGRTALQPVTA